MQLISKSEILNCCKAKSNNQLAELTAAFEKIKESIAGEDKSSAGDKFETARAMAQKEMELLIQQLRKAQNDASILEQIKPEKKLETGQLGSVVITKTKKLFLACAIGKVEVKGETIFVVSPISPIGKSILGKKVGEIYELAGNKEEVLALY